MVWVDQEEDREVHVLIFNDGPEDHVWVYRGRVSAALKASSIMLTHAHEHFDEGEREEVADIERQLRSDLIGGIVAWNQFVSPDGPFFTITTENVED